MPTANSSPGTLGLYINSFTKRGSSTNPYKQLLGTDGYGNYSGGNKLTDLFNYTNQYGYNYAIFYDLGAPRPGDDTVFVNTNNAETFLPLGQSVLETVFPLAHAAGLVDRGAALDINQHQNIAVGAFSPWDGLARLKRIINYNQSVAYDPTKIFTKIVSETEFWNFRYDLAVPMPGLVSIANSTSGGYPRGEIKNTPSGIDFTTLGLGVNDLVKVNNTWRQIVSVTSSIIFVDRPWTVPVGNTAWSSRDGSDGTVDYETYLYRVTKMCQYIATYGSGEEVELYIALPSYTLKGTKPAGEPLQLSRLYDAGVSKILLTAYQKTPSFDTGYFDSPINGNYASAPSGGYHRVSDDIVAAGIVRDIGAIISMESATLNNNNTCPGGVETDFNFSGYIMEGRSVLPHTTATNFRAIDSGGLPQVCNCCTTPVLTKPDITYNPLSMDEIWQYMAHTPPSGGICPACYPPQLGNTFNQLIAAGGTLGTNLDNYINFDTLIVFDQEFMRQLNITPAIAMSLSITGTNVTCNGAANGTATVGVIGGVAPFTYLWDDPSASTTASITGLAPGKYSCTVTDSAATSDSISITITEPSVISFTATPSSADCAGLNGGMSITGVSGGTSPYLYSVVPTGSLKVWTGSSTRTGLAAGIYDVSVASGDPNAGCFITVQRTVASASSFTISESHTNITCNGNSNGSITLTPTPSGSYTYNLYNVSSVLVQSNTTGVFNNLGPGSYTTSGVNSLGCTSNILGLTITQPSVVAVSTVEIVSPDCYLASNGSIEVSASGGTGPYSYTITYPTGLIISNSSGIFLNLRSGTYAVYAEDANGCTSSISFLTVDDPDPIVVDYSVTQPIAGSTTTGSITLQSISGGTAPIEYLWSTGATTESITDLSPGTYTVIITDNNNCNLTRTFTIRLECDSFSLEEMKILAYKAQCCAGDLAVKYINAVREGREDKTEKLLNDLKTLTMIIDTLYCTQNPGSESRITCEEVQNLIDLVNNICDCDCCKDPNYQTINVTYDPETGSINQI